MRSIPMTVVPLLRHHSKIRCVVKYLSTRTVRLAIIKLDLLMEDAHQNSGHQVVTYEMGRRDARGNPLFGFEDPQPFR
jgi:hypothetical protein